MATVCAHLTPDGRRLGAWPLTTITEDELEAFLNAQRQAGRKASTLNHLVQELNGSDRGHGAGPMAPAAALDGNVVNASGARAERER